MGPAADMAVLDVVKESPTLGRDRSNLVGVRLQFRRRQVKLSGIIVKLIGLLF